MLVSLKTKSAMDLSNFTRRLRYIALYLFPFAAAGQQPNYCHDAKFENKVGSMLSYSVPVMSVTDLHGSPAGDITILDAREVDEYNVSHIPGAIYIGANNPDWSVLDNLSKDTPIVLYCSIGYRSEKLGEKLQDKGYTKVFNLFGSIFEWANKGYELTDNQGNLVEKVHTYNRNWSQWVINPSVEKVW
jgi:rhodanese-related sulfurtransferase